MNFTTQTSILKTQTLLDIEIEQITKPIDIEISKTDWSAA